MPSSPYLILLASVTLLFAGVLGSYIYFHSHFQSVAERCGPIVYQHVSPVPLRLTPKSSQSLFESLVALPYFGNDVGAINVEMLAWAISVEPHRSESTFITEVYDEILLHVTLNDNGLNREYLMTFRRIREVELAPESFTKWRPNGDNWRREMAGPLTERELSSFVYESTFGPMAFFESTTVTVRTYGLFSDETTRLLKNGLSRTERQTRFDAWMRRNASPAQ